MSIFTSIKHHAVASTVVAFLVIFVAVVAGRAAAHKTIVATVSAEKSVSLVNVATFRKGNVIVSANGVVQSRAQVDLKSQTSAPVALINVAIGETVYTGQVLLELQNADIRAQLAQSLASLEVARGQYTSSAFSLDSARQDAVDKLRDAYNKTYDAVVAQADPILYNSDGNGGHLISYSPDTKLNSDIISTDVDLKNDFRIWKQANDMLNNDSSVSVIVDALKLAEKSTDDADILLSQMSRLISSLTTYANSDFSATLAGWRTTLSLAHTAVSTSAQSLTAAEMGLNTAGTSQTATAPAQVALAEAGVNNLRAQLAKTVITSPITGKISALPLRVGELASPGALLASVIGNKSGLTVKSYVSGDDLARLKVGTNATIGTHVKGTVSNIAPGVDATTRKAEVDIEIIDPNNSGLIIGQNVSAAITPANISAQLSGNEPISYLLPIQDVKIVPGEASVFTVDVNSKIVKHSIALGTIQGDFVEIKSGLSDDMNIVTPVYELETGDSVRVQ